MTGDNLDPIRGLIFVSYRRDDTRGSSGRIYDWLRIGFGREQVFRDVHSIGVGKWRDKINDALSRSAACVAVVGLRWAEGENLQRLRDQSDMVRHELLTALADDKVVMVPTLVEGAPLPDRKQLPSELQPLFDEWNARTLSEDGLEDDVRRLIVEIAEATSLSVRPDLDFFLRNSGAAKRRVAEGEPARKLQSDQVGALRHTIDDLTHRLAEASSGEHQELAEAFAALTRGDSLAAEDAFEREFETRDQAEEVARKQKAHAARNVANLALLRDVTKAVAFYRMALLAHSGDPKTAHLLGRALILIGDLNGAKEAMTQSLKAARDQDDQWSETAAQLGLGDVLLAQGDSAGALAAYHKGLQIAEALNARDPANTLWQCDLAVSHNRIGDVLLAQGDGPGALAAYGRGLRTREALNTGDPTNTEWQRDLSVSHERIGNVLRTLGDGAGALATYRKGLQIREALSAHDPANTLWQRDLAVSHNMIGNALRTRGDDAEALASFRKGLQIAEALNAGDPTNTEWQRDLAASHNMIGNALRTRGDDAEALASFRKGLQIAEALNAGDPTNTEWQRDLSVSHERIGNVLRTQGDDAGALAAFRKGLQIREALSARDPANTEWQRDVLVSHKKIGDVLCTQGDRTAALAAYRKGLQIAEALSARDPTNTEWQRDLSVSHDTVGNVLLAQDDRAGALASFRKGLQIAEALNARDPANAEWQRDLFVSHNTIGNVLRTQGDDAGTMAAYLKGLQIADALSAHDPTNAQWREDVAISCASLGTLETKLTTSGRRDYLLRGRNILIELEAEGRRRPNLIPINWFDEQLVNLSPGGEQSTRDDPAAVDLFLLLLSPWVSRQAATPTTKTHCARSGGRRQSDGDSADLLA